MIPETNLQNWPRDPRIKSLIIPREGFRFIEADLSQAEARVVAWYAQEERLIHLYESNTDIHSHVATIMFGHPVKKGMVERQCGKTISHASNYGMGPRKLVDILLKDADVVMEEKEARIRQNRYYQNFPGIKQKFQYDIRMQLKNNRRMIINTFGRKRKFLHPLGDELFRQAYSHIPQSTVADVVNKGLINCMSHMHLFDARVVAQIHDSLLFEFPVTASGGEFVEFVKVVRQCMTIPMTIHGRELVIPVEFKMGFTWGRMQEIA